MCRCNEAISLEFAVPKSNLDICLTKTNMPRLGPNDPMKVFGLGR